MGIRDCRQRCLEKIAYRHWLRNKSSESEENWNYALKVMNFIDKRITLVQKIMERKSGN